MDTPITHPIFRYRINYRRVLEVQTRLLVRTLLGEIPKYPSFCISRNFCPISLSSTFEIVRGHHTKTSINSHRSYEPS